MVEIANVGSAPPAPVEDGADVEALYSQGMGYYRRGEWLLARESLRRLKQLDPGRHGIDALLAELELFLRLDALQSGAPVPSTTQSVATPQANRRFVRLWLPQMLVGATALFVVLTAISSGTIRPRPEERIALLRQAGHNHLSAEHWTEAINAYERLLLLAPDDSDAHEALSRAYYERGVDFAATAGALEEQLLFAQAAVHWEKALADWAAAYQLIPEGDAFRSDVGAWTAHAERHRTWATLLGRAMVLSGEGRWDEAFALFQTVQQQAPDYYPEQVKSAMAEAAVRRGLALVAAATGVGPLRQALPWFEQAVTISPQDEWARAELLRARELLRAWQKMDVQDWEGVIGILRDLVRDDPHYADGTACYLLARAYVHSADAHLLGGYPEEALAEYRAAQAIPCGLQSQAAWRAAAVYRLLEVRTPPVPIPRAATPHPSATPTDN